jgi:DNA uptake protein ComE-like DNA-binding protein
MRSLDPNYLEDYKGYLLGIPFSALDSVYAFRSRGGSLFEMDQFQKITGLSDSACARLTPYFRFPKPKAPNKSHIGSGVRDLNSATAEELQMVRGIGPVLSVRIVRFREALGGFRAAFQLEDVYGLTPEIAGRVNKAFPLRTIPTLTLIALNRASAKELSEILYLNRQMARDIIAYRDRVGGFSSLNELKQVQSLPADKIDRIALYLQL